MLEFWKPWNLTWKKKKKDFIGKIGIKRKTEILHGKINILLKTINRRIIFWFKCYFWIANIWIWYKTEKTKHIEKNYLTYSLTLAIYTSLLEIATINKFLYKFQRCNSNINQEIEFLCQRVWSSQILINLDKLPMEVTPSYVSPSV